MYKGIDAWFFKKVFTFLWTWYKKKTNHCHHKRFSQLYFICFCFQKIIAGNDQLQSIFDNNYFDHQSDDLQDLPCCSIFDTIVQGCNLELQELFPNFLIIVFSLKNHFLLFIVFVFWLSFVTRFCKFWCECAIGQVILKFLSPIFTGSSVFSRVIKKITSELCGIF